MVTTTPVPALCQVTPEDSPRGGAQGGAAGETSLLRRKPLPCPSPGRGGVVPHPAENHAAAGHRPSWPNARSLRSPSGRYSAASDCALRRKCEVRHFMSKRVMRLPRIGIAAERPWLWCGGCTRPRPKDFQRPTGEHCPGSLISFRTRQQCAMETPPGVLGSSSRMLTTEAPVTVPGTNRGRRRTATAQKRPGRTSRPKRT